MDAVFENYAAPRDLADAARIASGGPATLLAGGTDLMAQQGAADNRSPDGVLVNLRRVPELNFIKRDGDIVMIGALATIDDIYRNAIIGEHAPVLAETADCFASDQIRNMATIGGNICNASPAGDMIIPLLLLDATLSLCRWEKDEMQTRRVALSEFFTGPGKTVLRADEILATVEFDLPEPGFAARFMKFGPRPALEIALASVGVAGVRDGKMLRNARVAFGAVAPTPIRATETEAALQGRMLDAAALDAIADIAADEASPISDARGSAWYRRHLVRVMTRELAGDVHGG